MSDLDLKLDHVGVAVATLDAAHETYSRLGFTLTARSIHSGSTEPGGPVVPWGSGNHCAMFEQGYLELIGITDPSLYTSVSRLLDKYQGTHIIALGVADSEKAYEVINGRSGLVQPAAKLERMAPFGPDNAEQRLAQFRNVHTIREKVPEGRMIFIQHLTRDVLWQPHLLSHANGAVAMAETAVCVPDLEATCARFTAMFAVEPKRHGGDIAVFDLGNTKLYVLTEAGLGKWAPGVTPPCLPWVAGFGVRVKDLAATEAYLKGQGFTVNKHPYPAIWLKPDAALGVVLSFIQA
jgi:catechol 2,3-dioxygenase-like lactoylglutathione lyase family enzyme